MLEEVPRYVDPFQKTEAGQRLRGRVAVAEMARLRPSLSSVQGGCEVEMEFGIDLEGFRYITGHLNVELVLVCQRCMESMTYTVDQDMALGLIHSEVQADSLPKHYDPLLVESNKLFLRELVEDEVLLGLPVVALHPPEQCRVMPQYPEGQQVEEELAPDRENPFAVLAKLKQDTESE